MNYIILVTLLLFGSTHCEDTEFNTDEEDWIDPTDMLHYDTSTRKMIKPNSKVDAVKPVERNVFADTRPDDTCSCSKDCFAVEKMLLECQQEVVAASKRCQIPMQPPTLGMPYLKRHINQLLVHFYEAASQDGEQQFYRVKVKLSSNDRERLHAFANTADAVQLQEIDEILSNLIISTSETSDDGQVLPSYFISMLLQMDVTAVVAVVMCVVCWYLLTKMSLFKFFTLIFLLSTFWHWVHAYKTAWATRQGELAQMEDEGQTCLPYTSSWTGGISYWFKSFIGSEDTCVKYHKLVLVDPFWDVSPTMALADTCTHLLTRPLGIIGKNIGAFYSGLYKNLPWWSFWFIMPATLVFTFFIILALFGYKVNLLYGFLSLGPSEVSRPITAPSQAALQTPESPQQVLERPQTATRDDPQPLQQLCRTCSHLPLEQLQVSKSNTVTEDVTRGAGGDSICSVKDPSHCLHNATGLENCPSGDNLPNIRKRATRLEE